MDIQRQYEKIGTLLVEPFLRQIYQGEVNVHKYFLVVLDDLHV